MIKEEASQNLQRYLEEFHPLPRSYISNLLFDNKKEFDTTTGIRHDKNTNNWKIGSSTVEINEKDLIIDGKLYRGTPGLYELSFKKKSSQLHI